MKIKLSALSMSKKIIINGMSLKKLLSEKNEDDNIPRLQEYCYGLCRHYFQLKNYLSQLLKKPMKEKDRDIELIILLAMYEITYMKTPAHAAVNEWVNVVKIIKKPWAKNVVNGVLRNYLRQQPTLVDDTHSHPTWLVDAIKSDWPNNWQPILHANNAHPPMICRVNQQKITVSAYLSQNTIKATPLLNFSDAIKLDTPCPVQQLPGFSDGLLSIQDSSAQLAANFLKLAPKQRILDACAAPGGKTCHILEREPNLDQLIALDNDNVRLARIADNLHRLGLEAELLCADACTPLSWWDKKPFDRILLDAPCSATGVIRRNPDIKIHRTLNDVIRLSNTQLRLLSALWPLLKPEGILLYATCSLLSTENNGIITKFLAKTDDAIATSLVHPDGIQQPHGLQFVPSESGGDGFFYAALQKKS